MLAFRGVLLLIFGLAEGAMLLLAFRVPDITTTLLIIVLTTFVIVDAAGDALRGRRRDVTAWRVGAAGAARPLIGLAAGDRDRAPPRSQALTTFAWWALLTGLLEGLEALTFSAQRHWRLVVAGLSIAFGLLVLGGSRRDTAVLVLAAGVYGVVAGITRLAAAGRVRFAAGGSGPE